MMTMTDGQTASPRRSLAAAGAVLVATAVICAWPLLAGDGWRTYQDNPCHLAGLHDLVRGAGGWSDAAFLGYPLTATHGPLWYWLLGRLAASGVPAGLLVALFDLLGFLAPALAILTVARRHAPLWAATLAAWLALVQRPWLAGFESPLGGMAPFGLAAAMLVMIVGELLRDDVTPRRLARLGAWYGLLGLTHLFLLLPAVLAFAAAAIADLRTAPGRRRVAARLAAATLGALVAAPYWLPALLHRGQLLIRDVPLAPHLGVLYLLLPLDPLALARGELIWQTELLFTDAVLMATVLGLGLRSLRHRRRRLPALLALTLALVVLALVPAVGEPLAGPHSWRRLMLVRLLLALAAAPVLATLPPLARAAARPRIVAAAAVALVISSLWWGRPLRLETPPRGAPEIAQLHEVWRWLAREDRTRPGRVFVQDTFYLEGEGGDLFYSHLPALTARETGLDQVGAFYGGMPFVTEDWTAGQFGLVFGRPLLDTADLLRLGRVMPKAAVDRLLLANPQLIRKMTATGLYRERVRRGRFAVLEPVDRTAAWLETGPGVAAETVDRRPGAWTIRATADRDGGQLIASLAWAPGWRAGDLVGASVSANDDGRLRVTNLPRGPHTFALRYAPARWPWLLALAGAAGLLGLAFRRRSAA